jgi:hypothetical protein
MDLKWDDPDTDSSQATPTRLLCVVGMVAVAVFACCRDGYVPGTETGRIVE